LEPRPN